MAVYKHFRATLSGLLRRGGERVDVTLIRGPWSPDPWQLPFPREELVLLWTPLDGKWQGKLAALQSNPAAGRAARALAAKRLVRPDQGSSVEKPQP